MTERIYHIIDGMTPLEPKLGAHWASLNANVLRHDDMANSWVRLFGNDGGSGVGYRGDVPMVCQQFPASFTPPANISFPGHGTKHTSAAKVLARVLSMLSAHDAQHSAHVLVVLF